MPRSLSGSTSYFSASANQRAFSSSSLSGCSLGQVVGLGAVVVGVEELPAVSSKWPRLMGTGPCSVTAFQPLCQMPRVPSIS